MNKTLSLVAGLGLVLVAGAAVAKEASSPSVNVTPIKGPLYMLKGRGGNVVASVGNDGVLLIDSDYAEYAEAHAEALAGLKSSEDAPRFLLNTHWHFDHVGGNFYWGEQGTVILAHENIYQRMSTRQEMKAFDRVVEPSPPAALPVVTYADAIAVRFNGDTLQVQHFPSGHTDGDSMVFFTEQNVVHMGDHYFAGAFPFVDLGSGGNVFGFIANVEKALTMMDENTVVVPGHGPLSTRDDLQADLAAIKSSAEQVSKLLQEGKSVEDITAQGLGPDYADYGKGFIKEAAWISFVAGSL
ncbi:MBL fold metallo-hydrolase [Pseudohalioglobus sediminis]|uniref:MBL fold metallo-hydrolase n=1 Tax=Pseudohalioglobus sediminis TaxID=2606449 RepID=A0A5B0WP90_9GAMM|nr:MBL fold metallo-hydrolase [Pseudohalioglobus sediminis]KAA1188822.1 MBL fold metallo-hydrolase [Pseudohalioglobus sediminis]